MDTLKALIEGRAAELGEKPFLLWQDQEVSYAELDRLAGRFAAHLAGLGVAKGDRVGILMANRPEYLVAWFGCLKLGAVAVPVNALFKPDEVAYVLQDAQARVLVSEERFAPMFETIQAQAPGWDSTILADGDAWRAAEGDPPQTEIAPDDWASIIYTSGTTGHPKGVILTHASYLWDARAIARAARMTSQDRFLCFLPLFHVNAQVVTVLAPMAAAGSMVLLAEFKPREFLGQLARYKVTSFSGVPTVYAVLLTLPQDEQHDLSRLRFCICGAAPMPVEVFTAFEKRYHAHILEGYGLSEGTCASSVNPLPEEGTRKIGSIGLPFAGQDMGIVDDKDDFLAAGEVGEIVVRGPNVMVGYFNNPEATREALRNGWLHTGDLGYRDEDGYYVIVGRKKEMIIRGGENIYPKEVEEVLYRHPAIAEAAVVGLPDPVWGEEVALFAVLRQPATPEELIAYCKEHLADYKCPRQVHIRESLPKTATGKIQKRRIVEAWEQEREQGRAESAERNG